MPDLDFQKLTPELLKAAQGFGPSLAELHEQAARRKREKELLEMSGGNFDPRYLYEAFSRMGIHVEEYTIDSNYHDVMAFGSGYSHRRAMGPARVKMNITFSLEDSKRIFEILRAGIVSQVEDTNERIRRLSQRIETEQAKVTPKPAKEIEENLKRNGLDQI